VHPEGEVLKPFAIVGMTLEDSEGLRYELKVRTKMHDDLTTAGYLNLSIDLAQVQRALLEQAPTPPHFDDVAVADTWLDRHPAQT
jgi:hypothetical protein